MSTTRWKIGEQVVRLLNGGNTSSPTWAKTEEVYEAISQVLNKLLKLDYLSTKLPNGETVPDGLLIATYESIPVTTYKNVSKCTLPAIPIALPRDMGLFYVGPENVSSTANILNSQFIPIPMGHGVLLQNQPMINGLLGQVGYERRGLNVIFSTDITAPPNNVTAVLIQMVVMDMSQYGDYDMLPIPADMESAAVEEVYKLFSSQKPPNKIDDPISNTMGVKQ